MSKTIQVADELAQLLGPDEGLRQAFTDGAGVSELRIDYGPGYHFAQSGPTTLLLLRGGDKGTHAADIRKVQDYWVEYQRRRREHDKAH